jgi:DNA mismatch repair protein MutS
VLARLDVLAGLAELAAARGYARPELLDEPILEIEEGRHPVLDQTMPAGLFVPNDARMGSEHGRFWLITGPNLSGKSTFIRQVALLTLMAQMGSFVPARRARIGIADRIFARVGASDDLSRGQSTFMVEMTEAANILNNATPRSLVILDEIGRGTSTYDGVSLAWAITEYLHDRIGCRALFATHYHELARLSDRLSGLRNHTVLVQEGPEGVVFLHKIAPGAATRSYGIHVARLAGVPQEVLQRAEQVLGELEGQPVRGQGAQPTPARRNRLPLRAS